MNTETITPDDFDTIPVQGAHGAKQPRTDRTTNLAKHLASVPLSVGSRRFRRKAR